MDPSISTLSRRGTRLANQSPLPDYFLEHIARADQDDYVPLCIAENKLVSDLVLAQLETAAPAPASVLDYDAFVGAAGFREQLSRFMERAFLGREFPPEQIAVLGGAGSVLEDMFYALADPGDAVLVPTPSYAGFWADLETRNELQIVPVDCASADGFQLTPDRLSAALAASEHRVRALLFTNPDNPLGKVATATEIEAVLRWAAGHDLHVVFDEIYALSVFGEAPFTSVAAVTPDLGDHIHIVWAFSKDFGASGLRCGLVVSENEPLLAAVNGLAYWGVVSGHTQWILGRMIADDAWVDHYCGELRRRLGAAHENVSTALAEARIPTFPAEAGIFVVCDMRRFMVEQTWDAENELWRRILEQANVNITPGAACRISEPGFMRVCYAAEPIDAVLDGIARVGRLLG
jgi:aspartate/methionine/tyrosine aminotransferase